MNHRFLVVGWELLIVGLVISACATPTPRTVKETIEVFKEIEVVTTVEIEKTVEVEKIVEVEKEVIKEVELNKQIGLSSCMFTSPREQAFFINEIIKPFETAYTVTVNFQILDEASMLEQARVQQETGHVTTDIVCTRDDAMRDWLDAGYIIALTPYVEAWDDRHFVTVFEANTHRDGEQYFLPIGADVYLLLVNNEALSYLPEEAEIANLTWEQYAEWAINIAGQEDEGKVCVPGVPLHTWTEVFASSALAYGAGFPDINSEAAVQAWGIWEQIGVEDGFVSTVPDIADCADPMMSEEVWLALLPSTDAIQVYTSDEEKFTLGPVPQGREGRATVARGWGYAIMKNAPTADLAVTFLEYMTRPEIQAKIARETKGIISPVPEAADYMWEEAEGSALDEVLVGATDLLENGIISTVPLHLYQDWNAVQQIFDDVFFDMIFDGYSQVDQNRLDEAEEEIEALLQ
ncbi:MAG: extracellular solute-binding protein [Anaerolineae bacterium]|nr:extracellular solute-binding protein [Anaerolineae bacterium]